MPEFIKTRMVYYDNQINELNSSNTTASITIDNPATASTTKGYGIARLKGTTHNWSLLPFNKYGLYLSANEMYYLFHASSKIIPRHMKVTLGHCVPIAKYPGTTNTTQLSFNNTIYSLIYELEDLENVTTQDEFPTILEFTNFRRTYDGASYLDNSRNNLPKADIIYKFPDYSISGNNIAISPLNIRASATTIPTSTTVPVDFDVSMTRQQLANEWIPEFLKDTSNVYVLYPGENQYEYETSIGESDFICIDTEVQQFNESQGTLDVRGGYHLNSNTLFKENNHLFQEVVPRVRYNGYLVATEAENNPNNDQFTSKRNLDQYFHQGTGALKDLGPRKIFIKGNPILDDGNSLVSHTFQALVTWTLQLDIVPRIEPIPRSLIEGFALLKKIYYRNDGASTITNAFAFSKPYPLRVQNQGFKSMPGAKNRLIANNRSDLATYSPSATDSGTWEYNCAQFMRGSAETNPIRETGNFNRTSMPAATSTNQTTTLEPMDTTTKSSTSKSTHK